ncbi:hypothetical protein GAY33_14690 [Azospirillum brasilense]|uniref:hypothetical protein n=1 Tax=Azospirillum argentinense TaxID=2970906 RepID=UPI00190BC0F1|nr:hypothetical protein [Azospirillum argentinense]MBK3800466.1 hypothetical protein [Azospirillum argentinense]
MAIIIGDDRPRRVYTVGGTPQAIFTVPFPFFAAADVRVIISAGGVDTELGLGASYGVTGTGETGGTVALFSAVANCTVTILRRMEIARTTSYPVAGTLRIEALNREAERVIMIAQQLAEQIGRSIKLPPSDDVSDMTLPPAQARAGRLLGFDASGNLTATTTKTSIDDMPTTIVTARNDAVAARDIAIPAALAAEDARDSAVVAQNSASLFAASAAHDRQIATSAATAITGFLKGPPPTTLSAFWPAGNRDLAALDDLTPFLNERLPVNRIDLARGTGFTRNLGSIT